MIELLSYITKNKGNIAKEAVNWMKQQYPDRTSHPEKCLRDIKYLFEAYISDLNDNTTAITTYVGNRFWENGKRQVVSYEAEIAVHNYIVKSIKPYVPQDQYKKLVILKDLFLSILVNGPEHRSFEISSIDNEKYLEVIKTFQKCQRNWDYTKTIDNETINFLLDAGYNVPTKQNLNSFKIIAIKDRTEIKKWASIARSGEDTFSNLGNTVQTDVLSGLCQNPQTDSTLLFLFFVNDAERTSSLRQERQKDLPVTKHIWRRNVNIEIGLSAGAIGIAATMKGLRTGFCGCIWNDAIPADRLAEWGVEKEDLSLMLGIGYPLHPEKFRTLRNDVQVMPSVSYTKPPYKKIII